VRQIASLTLVLYLSSCNPGDYIKEECQEAVEAEVAQAAAQCFDQISAVRQECHDQADRAVEICSNALRDTFAQVTQWSYELAALWMREMGCHETPGVKPGWECASSAAFCAACIAP